MIKYFLFKQKYVFLFNNNNQTNKFIMKKGKKLSLKKEKISSLTNSDMHSIKGGGPQDPVLDAGSTNHDFTCSWCTGGDNTTTCVSNYTCVSGGNLTCVSCPH